MTPPHMHMSLELLFNAGMLPINTVGEPGAHGATVLGTQGCGVNTPSLAAVAAATTGFDIELHIPNGIMLAMGLLSIMVAAGLFEVNTLFDGSTISVAGAAPKLHIIIAPVHTHIPIRDSFFNY
jgi:hypothetical protein